MKFQKSKTKINEYKVQTNVWLYTGKAAWHFVSIENPLFGEISELFADQKRGWGSLQIVVTIGNTSWETSMFSDNKTKSFLLPIKKSVRVAENIVEGKTISLKLVIKI